MDANKQQAAGAEGVSTAERSSLLGASSAARRVNDETSGSGGRQSGPRARRGQAKKARSKRHPAVRALLWTLRKSIVPLLLLIALIGGLYVGYAVLGKRPGEGVFELETWKHMYDLVFSES